MNTSRQFTVRSSHPTGSVLVSAAGFTETVTCGVMDALTATGLSSEFVEERSAGGIRA